MLRRLSPARLRLTLSRMARSLWFRPAVYALAAVGAVTLAPLLDPLLPDWTLTRVSDDDLAALLQVIASSMLAVAIFSLGTMVQALQAAAGAATPRARPLLSEDRTAQTAISTFLGAFVFAIVGLVGQAIDVYDAAGRTALYAVAVALLMLVTVALVAWIQRLSRMGGVAEAVALVALTARRGLAAEARRPWLGAAPAPAATPRGVAVEARAFGFVQLVDVAALSRLGRRLNADVHVLARPGDAVEARTPVAVIAGFAAAADAAAARDAFVIGRARSFDADPRLGLLTLSEIASRALSPAVNDPGTALDVLASQVTLLADWRAEVARTAPDAPWPRVFAAPLAADAVLDDAFRAIARDGAGLIEVAERLHAGLAALAAADPAYFAAAARRLSGEAAARAQPVMGWDGDLRRIEALRRRAGLTP